MTKVVLRLQGLNTEAGSEDIRKFFHGLLIPEGGVHITGGEKDEAFIIFQTEREAQLAMRNSGKLLRGSSVSLHISSLAELKHKLESRLRKADTPAVETAVETVPSASFSPDINATLLLSLVSAIQGQLSSNKVNESPALNQMPEHYKQTVQQPSPNQTNADCTQSVGFTHRFASKEPRSRGQNLNSSKPGYLRLYGLPNSVVEHDVRYFLQGLSVLGIITNVQLPLGWCCLVKLGSFAEAEKGLKYNHRKFKEFNVEVRLAHEKMWTDAMEQSGKCMHDMQSHAFSDQKKASADRNAHEGFSRRRVEEQPSSGSPKRYWQNPPPHTELYVIVNNLSKNITKTEIKNIFSCPEIPNSRIKHLLNKWGERTSTAFITFEHAEDYAAALNMNGTTIGFNSIEVSSITREEMFAILSRNRILKIWRPQPYRKAKNDLCIYARNFPANVTKTQVRDFFMHFQVCDNQIRLLVDSQGNGIGDAIVKFGCEKNARQAQRALHGMCFMGTKILLTLISHQQMKEILRTR